MKSFNLFSRLLIFSLMALFLLAACERPTPREDEIQVTEVPPANATPLTLPSPTVGVVATESAPPAEPTVAGQPPEGEQPDSVAATAVPEGESPVTVPENTVHVVKGGDTLFRLALIYGVSVEEIAAANGLTDVDTLKVGQELTIPAPGTVTIEPTATPAPPTEEIVHVVQPGENLFRIGLRYGFTVTELATYNGIANPDRIEVGQEIRIPPQS